MRINRNIVTNIAGAIVAMWTSNQAVSGRLTINQLVLAVPTAIVSIATGSKDSRIEEIERQLNLSPGDQAAVKGIGEIVLNRVASRFGYKVISDDLDSGNSFDRGDGLGRSPVGAARNQYRDHGDVGLSAETLERLADGDDYGDRGPAVDPAARVARYWQGRPSDLPVVGSPTIEGANISGVEFAARSMAQTSDDPPSEAW